MVFLIIPGKCMCWYCACYYC